MIGDREQKGDATLLGVILGIVATKKPLAIPTVARGFCLFVFQSLNSPMLIRDIFEGRDAPLYHGTAFYNATRILATNTFDARTLQNKESTSGGHFSNNVPTYGVSLSRDPRFARTFGPIIFVLNQTKLRYRYKILPVDYWARSPEAKNQRKKGNYAEAEEFVVGEIKDADRYILSIDVDSKYLKSYQKAINNDDRLSILLDHPLLNMI